MENKIKEITVEIKDINDDERTFVAVASTEDIDRDNDRIVASGWDLANFKKNPVIPWAHHYSEPPVAKAVNIGIEGSKLMFTPKFPTADEYPFADTIFKLYKGGYLRAFSVGFKPKRYEVVERSKGVRGYDYLETELFEVSACTVPSNPNALIEATQKGIISEDEAKSIAARAEKLPGDKRLEIEKRLDEIEKIANLLEHVTPIIDRLSHIEQKLDALIASQPQPEPADMATAEDADKQSLSMLQETPAGATAPGAEEIITLIEGMARTLDGKIGKAIEKAVNYHLGKVD